MPKQLLFDDHAREHLRSGASQIAEAVRITLGPRGRNVVLDKKFGPPVITNDGDAMDKVGKDGVITVEEGQGFGIELDVVEGMQFDRGYVSAYFATDQDKMEAVLDHPLVLLSDRKLTSAQDVLPALEVTLQNRR